VGVRAGGLDRRTIVRLDARPREGVHGIERLRRPVLRWSFFAKRLSAMIADVQLAPVLRSPLPVVERVRSTKECHA
jgi:hypothetical protein